MAGFGVPEERWQQRLAPGMWLSLLWFHEGGGWALSPLPSPGQEFGC